MNRHITDFLWKNMQWRLENEKIGRHLRVIPLQNKNMGRHGGEMPSKTPATDAISPAVLTKKIFRTFLTPLVRSDIKKSGPEEELHCRRLPDWIWRNTKRLRFADSNR